MSSEVRTATAEALLDAAERLLERGATPGSGTRRLGSRGRGQSRPRPLLLRLDGGAVRPGARAVHRPLDRAPTGDVRGRSPLRREVADGVALPGAGPRAGYPKIWIELQALAWNRPSLRERVARVNAEWRAVLREAFARAPAEYGLGRGPAARRRRRRDDESARGSRSSGCRGSTRVTPSCWPGSTAGWSRTKEGPDDMTIVDGSTERRARRAESRALPGRGGLRRARRRAGLLGALRRRRPDRPAAPHLDARALARVEGADRLPRAPLPRRHVRPARQRAVRPARGPDALRRVGVRRGRARGPGRDRHRAGGDRGLLARRAARRCCSPPSTPSGCSRRRSSAPWFPASRLGGLRWRIMAHPRLRGHAVPAAARGPLVGKVQRRALAPRLRRLRRLVRPARCSTRRTRRSRSRTRSAGRTRPTRRRSSPARSPRAPPPRRVARSWRSPRRVRCPVLVISAPNDKITSHADARALAACHRTATCEGR